MGGLAVLLWAERVLLSSAVHRWFGPEAPGLGGALALADNWRFRFALTFAVLLVVLATVRADARLAAVNRAVQRVPLRLPWVAAHAAAVAALGLLEFVYTSGALPFLRPLLPELAMASAALALAAGLVALAPAALWARAARALGRLWLYAAAAAAAAVLAIYWSERLWAPTAALTFNVVRLLLLPLLPGLHTDGTALIIGTESFAVQIFDVCSGLEGVGLMAVFCAALLFVFRREFIFPRALLVVPVALLMVFVLNAVRIAALVLIGNAGFPEVALTGFHSQAGWLAFNLTAGLVALGSARLGWLSRARPLPRTASTHNPTAVYLLPYLAVLAVGMFAASLSSGFDTLYWLRPVAAALALCWSWPRLTGVDWRFSWRGPTVGVAVFALWIGTARLLTQPAGAPAALLALPAWMRDGWLIARVGAAVLTVPIAEELAYRGYLLRRLQSSDFESVPFTGLHLFPVMVTSVIFGASHGALWPAGLVAGFGYAALLRRTGQLGEAVAAHATTNALLAAYVLSAGQWQLW
jgi:exosortase E/protease (VPEID-CTERM system)